jgi:DNA-binding response OmpR family regulator
MNILVAEDSVAYAVLYQQIFESRGHSVKITLDGDECLSIYKSNTAGQNSKPYDMVLLDYSMPKKTGFEVAKEILDITPSQKILFITGYGDEVEAKIDGLGKGKNISVLEKPFNSSKLIEIIEHYLKEELANKVLQS